MFDSVRPQDHTHRKSLSYFMTATESANVRTVFTEVKDKIINTRQKSY